MLIHFRIIGWYWFFQKHQVQRLIHFCHFHPSDCIIPSMHVYTYIYIRAHCFSHRSDSIVHSIYFCRTCCPVKTVIFIRIPSVVHIKFYRIISAGNSILCSCSIIFRTRISRSVKRSIAINTDFIPELTPQKLINRYAKYFTCDIPKCCFYCGKHSYEDT